MAVAMFFGDLRCLLTLLDTVRGAIGPFLGRAIAVRKHMDTKSGQHQ